MLPASCKAGGQRAAGDLLSAEAQLLTHDMASAAGGLARAATLLFVPRQPAPAGGWPAVAWAHGTTTAS